MDAPALDQAFREHEGDDLCLWLDDDDEPQDDASAPLFELASMIGFAGRADASAAWSSRLRSLLSLPTIAP